MRKYQPLNIPCIVIDLARDHRDNICWTLYTTGHTISRACKTIDQAIEEAKAELTEKEFKAKLEN